MIIDKLVIPTMSQTKSANSLTSHIYDRLHFFWPRTNRYLWADYLQNYLKNLQREDQHL